MAFWGLLGQVIQYCPPQISPGLTNWIQLFPESSHGEQMLAIVPSLLF